MARMASLKKDQGDHNQFRHHRNRNMGHCVSWEYRQPLPMIFTRESSQVNLIGHYRGRAAFMICNGPSLVSGRYDLTLLKKPGVITYGINNGPKTVRPNFWTCVDDPKRFLKSIWLDPTICKIVPHAHAEKPLFDSEKWTDLEMPSLLTNKMQRVLVGDCPNVLYFHRNSKFMADRFLEEDTINWGNAAEYGGGRSVMLPTLRMLHLLGFRKVFMLGADFKMSENYTYHFDEQRNKGAVRGNMSTYDRMKNEYFPALKPIFDEEGFEVYNCTEGSELKTFPFVKYEDAIQYCMEPLGDLVNERTWGLYSKPEERQKWKDEPAEQQKAHANTIINKPSAPVAEADAMAPQLPKINQINVRRMDLVAASKRIPQGEFTTDRIGKQPMARKQDEQPALTLTQMYPDSANKLRVDYPKDAAPKDAKIVKSLPCGPIETMGSSRQPTTPRVISKQSEQGYITLPDDGK